MMKEKATGQPTTERDKKKRNKIKTRKKKKNLDKEL